MSVSVESVREQAKAVWPQIDWTSARLEQGAFHDVLIAQEVVARIARSRFAADAMPERLQLLRRLEGRAGRLEVPVVLSEMTRWSRERAGVLLSFVPGQSRSVDEPLPAAALEDVLSHLRCIEPSILGGSTVRSWCGGPDFARLVADEIAPDLSDELTDLARQAVADLLEAEEHAPSCPIHGDLTPFNIRWVGDAATGLLDWDFAAIGDPATDVAGILTTLGTDTARQLCDESTLARAAVHRATFPLQIACAGHLHEDERLRATGIRNFQLRAEQNALHWPSR